MNRYWFFLVFAVLVIGCQPQVAAVTGTPTATIPPLAGDPIPVELSALAANPTVYENAYIRLTGQYTHQPRLVCESDPHPSPVTWGLRSETLLALAGGFDEQLRPLLPPGLTMTVAGRWRHWKGDVGCGVSTQEKDLWYVQVTEIITPTQLTQVTLTPAGMPVAQAGETPSTEGTTSALIEPTQPAGAGTLIPPTPSLPGNEPTKSTGGETAVPGTTAIASATTAVPRTTPSPTTQFNGNTVTLRSTGPATATTSGTATPSVTPLAGATATSGPTPTSSSGLATSTPAPTPEEMGVADPESLIMEALVGDESHLWTFDNELANNTLTIQVASVAQANIAITVYDPNGVQIANQNSAGTGTIETITDLNLPNEGIYDIVISDSNKAGGDYAMIVLDELSFYISFHQIDYGTPQNTSFTEDEEQVWFFDGMADDSVTISADPTTGTPDIGFEFIGPLADPLEFIDLLLESGDPEVLSDYVLTDTGLYAIWLYGTSTSTMNVRLSVNN